MHEGTLRRSLQQNCGYTVTLTGHSLGAGVATYAAVLLQRRLGWRVKVRAVSPPPPLTPAKTSSVGVGHWSVLAVAVQAL